MLRIPKFHRNGSRTSENRELELISACLPMQKISQNNAEHSPKLKTKVISYVYLKNID